MTVLVKPVKLCLDYVDALPDMMCLSSNTGGTFQWRLPLYQEIFDAFMTKISIKPCSIHLRQILVGCVSLLLVRVIKMHANLVWVNIKSFGFSI
jgi:hypothetical protein